MVGVGLVLASLVLAAVGGVDGNVAAGGKKETPTPTAPKKIDVKQKNEKKVCSKDRTIEWHFVITQIDDPSDAPPSITVQFANSGTVTVPLYDVTGKTAHYYWYTPSPETMIDAWTTIYGSWKGQFNLSHAECV